METFLGALGLIALLAFAYGIARVGSAIEGASRSRLLVQLAPRINGVIDPSGPVLNGTYGGRSVRVSIMPGDNRYRNTAQHKFNACQLQLWGSHGKQSWDIHLAGLRPGTTKIVVDSRDETLTARLEAAGVLKEVITPSPGDPYYVVNYQAPQDVLVYNADVSPRKIPTDELFATWLVMMDRLATINERANNV